ncbi:hypothetical protein [Candidatus Marinarcus aquaticus]|uniref:General glycosylation pathway protein n=1 Tax=Candidatus Marinarcus aquaticus TaxID=2044504 RepID=A0A4Q0XSW1_9BACT|nr:hypothetical protein [Candidatus Marinarcus aquaticus]RXJ60560.1 hypothetical protein CRV04_00660 [Candidatus Marinarcus aquaticus]
MKKGFENLTTLIYLLFAVILTGISLAILWWSTTEVIEAIKNYVNKKEFILVMLQSVGTVIISIAILDISKYMIEEEVFRNKELREPKEARRTLTKIMTIIAIAVSVEGLVYIFKAGANDMHLLIYPAMLILTAVFVIIGLGIYQKLSYTVEH